jgi:hypothetical protein
LKEHSFLKEYLQKGFKDTQLSSKRKNKLQQAMITELSLERESTWKKHLRRFNVFLESTYEINLVPLWATLGVLILFVNFGLSSILPDSISEAKPGSNTSYFQETSVSPDGKLTIQFIPISKEDHS